MAGGKILVNHEVTAVPLVAEGPDELQKKCPTVFPVCAVTRAMVKTKECDVLNVGGWHYVRSR